MLETLSRAELRQLFDLSQRCLVAESCDDLQALLTTLGSITSFERAALCVVSATGEPSLDHFVNHSFGSEWGALYTAAGFDRVDPVLRHSRSMHGTFRWRDAFEGSPSGASATFRAAARDFGLVAGVAFACRSRTAPLRTLLSLGTRNERGSSRITAILSAIGPHIHEAYDRLRQHDDAKNLPAKRIELSAREREVLVWTQAGKTYWEIGQIIGISQNTVKYHFTRIKEKLDVVSASHAIARAMRLRLLE